MRRNMENKFKIGDEVVCVDNDDDCWYKRGDRLIVSSEGFIEPCGHNTVYNIIGEPSTVWILERHFELAEDPWESRKLGCDESYAEVVEGSKEAVDKALGIKKHNHYFKDCPYDKVDVYLVCELFEINDPSGALHHAIKKLLCSGYRGVKDKEQDIREAVDSLNRYLDIQKQKASYLE